MPLLEFDSLVYLDKRLRLLGIAAKDLTVRLAAIVNRLVMSSSTSNAAAATAAVLGILNDEVSRAMGCQCGPKQSAIVDQLALEKIPTVGRRARIQNATRSERIRFGRLAQRIDCRLLDVCIMVREEGAEMTSMYIYNHEIDTYMYICIVEQLTLCNE